MNQDIPPLELRRKIRRGEFTSNTSGNSRGYEQCNLCILPADYASEFLQFCQSNPKPCPLIGMASSPGDYRIPKLGEDLDIRTDIPSYRIFENGELSHEVHDISDIWRDDLVSFVLGCSFSFEEALIDDGLEIRNVSEGVNVPMYRTDIDCNPAGRFTSKMVVSMRPMIPSDAIRAIQICTRFPAVHGAPVHFGDPGRIGIKDINQPEFGDAVTIRTDEVPIFWACGVTPQVAVEQARPPFCITHSPGCMLVSDLPNSHLAVM
jgi:uncharacterized protein YcsI (UPF0317 family)